MSSVTSQNTRSAPAPPRSAVQRLLDRRRMGDFGPAVHRDLGGRADLALQAADNEKTHGYVPLCPYEPEPALMISVMVTPSRSSTSTTSPRATSRSLT